METFNNSISKIRKGFIIASLVLAVITIIIISLIFTWSLYTFIIAVNSGASPTAGFEFILYSLGGVVIFLLIPVVLVILLMLLGLLWGIFGIIYAVKKRSDKF